MIGATTLAEYRKIERDAALARRFSPVMVEEPSVPDTVAILHGLRSQYEEHHGVRITDAALEAAARLSDRYISEYRLPDKAIDLVDQAAARVRLRSSGSDRPSRLRPSSSGCRAEKQAAVDAEAYEDAGEIKQRIERLEAAAGRAASQTKPRTARGSRQRSPLSESTSAMSPSSPPAPGSRSASWWPPSSSGSGRSRTTCTGG